MSIGSFLLKRGTAAQLGAITPPLAEPIFTTDTLEFRVGDGATPGGITPRNFSSPRSYPGSVSEVSAVSTYTVQTWAALKALDVSNLSAGSSFYVKGKNVAGDGREGRYTYDPTSTVPAIEGLVLIPNVGAGRFLRDYTDVINVFRDMGADNTATTDSGAIIQAALDFAANPTYGWAKDSGSAGGLGLAVELHGAFISTIPLVLKGAVDFRGVKVGGRANDFSQYACIHAKHGGHCITYDLNNDTPHFKLASIRNMFLVGYVETYIQNKKSITNVISRTVFKVYEPDAPTGLDPVPYSANNVCVFFDNQGTCLGTGRIASLVAASGEVTVTLEGGTDMYSSVNSSPGGLLTTACKVVFTPKVTEESVGGFTDFYDPSAMGCTGIYIKNTHPTLSANVPYMENVYMRQFMVGIRVGPRCFGGSPGMGNIGIMFCKVAGMCFPRCISTTDFFFNDQIYVHGGRRYDYGRTGMTNVLDQPALAYGTYGLLGSPIASKFDRLLLEEVTLACFYISRNIFTHINHLLCDGICGNGILVGPGYSAYVAPASSQWHSNAMYIGSFYARKKLDDGTSWDTIHTTTTPVAIRFEATTISSGLPTYIHIGSAAIMTSQDFTTPTPKFVYAFDLGPRGSTNYNRVRIGMMQERNGFITMHKAGTKEVEFDDRSVLSAAEVYTGWYWDHATSTRKYCNATVDVFSLSSSGVTAGGSSFSGVPLTAISNTGSILTLQKVGGSPQRYSAVVSTSAFILKDDDLALNSMSLFCTSGAIQLWIGSNSGNSGAARSSNLYSENRIGGTDLAPSNLNIVGPGGTGAASANGAINFYTANPGVSGTTPQSISLKLQLLREGQFRFQNLSPTSLGEGDLWFDSTKGFRQYFNAGNRPVGFKRVGTVTLVAGTATVALGALITSATIIELTSQVDGGTPGFLRVSSRVDGVSFTITSSSPTDTSTVSWSLIEP